jgi:hypothetical protein
VVELFENVIEVVLLREVNFLEAPEESQPVEVSVILQDLPQSPSEDDFVSNAVGGQFGIHLDLFIILSIFLPPF